ncbi:MAG: ATP-dependent RNA helicase [Beijerinckiaceae bacterium]|nr:MAG: ATP-dependent RNA helicase [Beijerinckiaceae bacterium]
MTFFQTSPMLARALAERQYNDPTPVQTAVLTPEAEGRDILVSAQTGSGKTVAYGLAMATTLLGDAEVLPRAGAPLALIIAPTRELAMQVERELVWLYEHARARIISCVGGMDSRAEGRKLEGGAHIVVGTPGRLRDHIERGRLVLGQLQVVVLDEADEMMALGFREDLEFILEATPESRRTLLFSATMPKVIATLAQKFQKDALRLEVASGERGHADIEYRAIRVAPKEHELAVVNLLRFVEAETAIVFCNTRESVRHLNATLLERGFNAVLLSGELSQSERNHSMQALRDGRARVCVATDVAARGIDLPNLGLVIHAELPNDAETLQHRSGRTGRAGRKGVSAMLVPASRHRKAHLLIRDAGVQVSWGPPPSAEDIRKLDQQRMLADPMLTQAPDAEDIEMGKLLLDERSPEHVAAALIRIYRSRLPAIEDVTDPGSGPEFRDNRAPGGKPTRESRAPWAEASGDGVWFRLDIGRKKNADPKWLLPMLCRKGGVTRNDIGAIRIFDHETKFEITGSAAAAFEIAMKKPGGDDIAIERLRDGAAPSTAKDSGAPARPRRDRDDAPRRERPVDGGKPYEGKSGFKPKLYDARPPRDDKPFRDGKPPREGAPARDGKPFKNARPPFNPDKPYRDSKPYRDDKPYREAKPYRDETVPSARQPFQEKQFRESLPQPAEPAKGGAKAKYADKSAGGPKKDFGAKKDFAGKEDFAGKKEFGARKDFGAKKPFAARKDKRPKA